MYGRGGNATGFKLGWLSDSEPESKPEENLGAKIFGRVNAGTDDCRDFTMSLNEAVDSLKRQNNGIGEELLKNSKRVLVGTGIFNTDGTPNRCIPMIKEPGDSSKFVSCRRRKNGKTYATGAIYYTDLIDENGKQRGDFGRDFHRPCVFVASARGNRVKRNYSEARTEIRQSETGREPRSPSVIHCIDEKNTGRSASVRHM